MFPFAFSRLVPIRPLSAPWMVYSKPISSKQNIKAIFNGESGLLLPPTSQAKDIGKFGVSGLQEPKDLEKLSISAQQSIFNIQKYILQQDTQNIKLATAENILSSLDSMSQHICSIADVSEVGKQLVTDSEWSSTFHSTNQELHSIISQLNSDPRMAHQSAPIVDSEVFASLSPEQKIVASSLVEEFKSQGLCLSETNREVFLKLKGEIGELTAEAENLLYGATYPSKTRILSQFQKIVSKRHELAALLGHASYADQAMRDRAKFTSPAGAVQFLENLQDYMDDNYTLQKENTIFSGTGIDEFLSLGNCMEGLSILVKELFGISLQVSEFQAKEKWDSSVFRLELLEADGSIAGIAYLDLFEREGKFSGAATFCLNFSTASNQWDIPRAFISMNLSKKSSGHRLKFEEANTLFHEFGHLLNILLSRTHYQHLAGVRSAIDFVEMPSTLLEHFFKDFRVLSQFAKHSSHGTVLPYDQYVNVMRRKQQNMLSDTKREVMLSLFDLNVHGNLSPGKSWTEIEENILRTSNATPSASLGVHTFNHLIYYGSAYYSYLLCNVFSSTAYTHCFQDDPFNRDMGEKFRKEILGKGGEGTPEEMMKKLTGNANSLHFPSYLRLHNQIL